MVDIRTRSFLFAVRIVRLCQDLDDSGGVCRTISWQLMRSGTSIGANIEEAQGGQSRADFTAKMFISLKEARETLYWLKLIQAADLVPIEYLTDITEESDRLIGVLTSILRSTRTKTNQRKN